MHALTVIILASSAPLALALGISGQAGEVVGATGRIGSLLLRAGSGRLAAVPRGVAPGGLSPAGTPIIVATHASALESVLKSTPENRVADLVLLSNGMVRETVAAILGEQAADSVTCGCVYFGVPAPGADATHGAGAPATALAGTHAATIASLIQSMGPRCTVLEGVDALDLAAQLKMLWSSALWLICAARGCTVSEAHARHPSLVRALVKELLVECAAAVSKDVELVLQTLQAYSDSLGPDVVPSAAMARSELAMRNGWFLRSAFSAGRVQPTHEALLMDVGLTHSEIRRTAGSGSGGSGGSSSGSGGSGGSGGSSSGNSGESSPRRPSLLLRHAPSGLAFHAREAVQQRPQCSSVIVVGAGMLGSALALELALRGLRVTVIDRRAAPAPSGSTPSSGSAPSGNGSRLAGDVRVADATSGSWAWLNANGKAGTYGELNRLGMSMWRRFTPYQEVADWCGSLVASSSAHGEAAGGAYAVQADLEPSEVRALEPNLCWRSEELAEEGQQQQLHMHHYPDEGIACPHEAVTAVRAAAEAAGASFLWSMAATEILHDCDEGGKNAKGVRIGSQGGDSAAASDTMSELRADAVALAAGVEIGSATGIGSAAVPMLHSPGMLAYTVPAACSNGAGSRSSQLAEPADGSDAEGEDALQTPTSRVMRRILVDTTSGVHCLQRRDGRCVIGGSLRGYGRIGAGSSGSASAPTAKDAQNSDISSTAQQIAPGDSPLRDGEELLQRAAAWLPAVGELKLEATTLAQRVVPADGLPAIGWSASLGAYVLAAHSGITLAPVLAAVAAAEIAQGVELDLVDCAWRPDRQMHAGAHEPS